MSAGASPEAPRSRSESAFARRRRLATVFGDVLEQTTREDRSGPEEDPAGRDDWLREQVPPHHGG